jgi:hypothetical protein
LGVWFVYGGNAAVAQEIAAAIKIIPLDTWLQAIPQLIARLLVRMLRRGESDTDIFYLDY